MARNILVVVPDLFFSARIREVAQASGVSVREAAPAAAAAEAARLAPDLILVDLHGTPDPRSLIAALRAAAPECGVVGFHSHVDTAVRDAALEAGATRVLPRSAFTRRLPELLAGGA